MATVKIIRMVILIFIGPKAYILKRWTKRSDRSSRKIRLMLGVRSGVNKKPFSRQTPPWIEFKKINSLWQAHLHYFHENRKLQANLSF